MKIHTVSLAAIASLISSASFYLALPSPTPPAPIVLRPASYDFGLMDGDKTLAFEAEAVNNTSAPIRLKQVLTGCDCTTSNVHDLNIPPYSSIKLPLKWRLEGRRGPSSTTISAEYQIPGQARPIVTKPLTLICDVIREYEVSPSSLSVAPNGQPSRLIFRTVPGRPPVHIIRIESSNPALEAVLETPDRAGAPEVVAVTVSPEKWDPTEATKTSVLIRTSCPYQPTVEVPVRIE